MVLQAILVAVLGGIICLDRIVLQAMISRPIVTGPLIGFLLHDPYTGLITGAFIELFWIDRLPIGTYIPPNDTLATIIITAAAILCGQQIGHTSRELIALTFLLFLPVGILGQKLDAWKLKQNELRVRQATEEAKIADCNGICRKHRQSIWQALFFDVIFILMILIPATILMSYIYPKLPVIVMKALVYIYFLLPILGVGIALNTIHVRGKIPVFCGLFLTVSILIELFRHG